MRNITLISMLLTAILVIGCEKQHTKVTDMSLFYGTWTETYDEYSDILCVDGAQTYTFYEDKDKYRLECYDVFSGSTAVMYGYYKIQDNVVIMDPSIKSDSPDRMFEIISLTENEMEWQRVGTEFSIGTLISDYKHFSRSDP